MARAVSDRRVQAEYKPLVLDAEGPAVSANAGQFFQILCPASGSDYLLSSRPMGIYQADPAQGGVDFLYKVTSGRRSR